MTKFGTRTQILILSTEMWERFRNSQIQDGGRTPYWKSFLAITRLHIVRLRWNLEFGSKIARERRLDDENVKFRKSKMAVGRHFENRYSSISQPRIVRVWRNLVRRRKFWAGRRKRDKKSQISKFKVADGRHIENHFFLLITRLHRVQLRRTLEFGGIIAHTRRLGDENVQFRKSNMADGRHFENHYISHISAANTGSPNCTKFCMRTQILPQATEKKSEIRKFKMADGCGIKNHFLAITQLHVVPLRWNLEWGGRITRIRSRSGDQNA